MRQPGPDRGEIWVADLDLARGREQAGVRPALVVSTDSFNHGAADLVVVLPLTTRGARPNPFHIPVNPPEGSLRQQSYIKCEDIRSVSKERLRERWGTVSGRTMAIVEDRLRVLLEL